MILQSTARGVFSAVLIIGLSLSLCETALAKSKKKHAKQPPVSQESDSVTKKTEPESVLTPRVESGSP